MNDDSKQKEMGVKNEIKNLLCYVKHITCGACFKFTKLRAQSAKASLHMKKRIRYEEKGPIESH